MSPMDEADVFDRVTEVITKVLDVDPSRVTLESDLVTDLGADSIDRMTLVMAIEDAFQERVPEDQLPSFTTVGAIVSFITDRLRAGNASRS